MAQTAPYMRGNPLNIQIALHYAPLGIVQAVTENISSDHMQVNTGAITLNRHAEVEIVVSIPGPEYPHHHRIAAQVAHCGEGGYTTLNFHCCDAETMVALQPYFAPH